MIEQRKRKKQQHTSKMKIVLFFGPVGIYTNRVYGLVFLLFASSFVQVFQRIYIEFGYIFSVNR